MTDTPSRAWTVTAQAAPFIFTPQFTFEVESDDVVGAYTHAGRILSSLTKREVTLHNYNELGLDDADRLALLAYHRTLPVLECGPEGPPPSNPLFIRRLARVLPPVSVLTPADARTLRDTAFWLREHERFMDPAVRDGYVSLADGIESVLGEKL